MHVYVYVYRGKGESKGESEGERERGHVGVCAVARLVAVAGSEREWCTEVWRCRVVVDGG